MANAKTNAIEWTATDIDNEIEDKLLKYFATSWQDATKEQIYKALALSVRDRLVRKKNEFNTRVKKEKAKRVYYLSMEFLLGRSLRNNLYNLGMSDVVREALQSHNVDLNTLYEIEADAGLGNGGLGRLAACFMDALSSQDYPALGFTLKYEYGLFKQRIIEDTQVELPDEWLSTGEYWLVPRTDKTFRIHMGGYVQENWIDGKCKISYSNEDVFESVPYDMMISGGPGSSAVNVLRLWTARSGSDFNMTGFSQGDYLNVMQQQAEAELISKVLYPADDHYAGKLLRLNQQYFLVSASLQNILCDHLKNYGTLDHLADKIAVHINDTHPALCVPEMMRLLIDEHGYDWDTAWDMTTRILGYTNHTVMVEALEAWGEDLIARRLPRIHMLIKEINRRFIERAKEKTNDWDQIRRMSVIDNGVIRMANLSVIGSHKVNGVSALHSDIIKQTIFKDFYTFSPDKFTNVTNGIAHRRWLAQSNPRLTTLIESLVGSRVEQNADLLKGLAKYADNESVLSDLAAVKRANKADFSDYIKKTSGFVLNPDSRFDVQIKRLHEYKRQLMNVLKILALWLDLKDHPSKTIAPQTFIFGAKAAAGYYHAKRVISLINRLSEEIGKDARIKSMLDVMFVENYNVSKAERLIPAAEVSEQISLAGKEASGTSNMKFMINGAVTLGTLDGANVEIDEAVGRDNIFIFGMTAKEVEDLWQRGYYATYYYSHDEQIKRVVDYLQNGFAGGEYRDIAHYLTTEKVPDPYMCQADFRSYMQAHQSMDAAYADTKGWNRKSLINISEAGRFSADRSIRDYCRDIWDLKPIK